MRLCRLLCSCCRKQVLCSNQKCYHRSCYSSVVLYQMLLLPLQEAVLRQSKTARQSDAQPGSLVTADTAPSRSAVSHATNSTAHDCKQHAHARQLQEHRQHVHQHSRMGHPDSSAPAATASPDSGNKFAREASQRPARPGQVPTASAAKASKRAPGKKEDDCTSGGDAAAAANVVSSSQTAAQHACVAALPRHKATDSSASTQHIKPEAFVVEQSRAGPQDTASGSGPDHALPCTPGTGHGPLQEQPCTPGLVSSSSACCVLPRSCSSNGGDSSGSGLEAENSIRFRKRSKFEALKARREEARQKAEVPQATLLAYVG